MAHNILERDSQTGIAMAWHKKTNVVPVITKENCKILYPMEKQVLMLPSGVQTDYFAIVSQDDNFPIGSPVGSGYTLIDNEHIWDMTAEALGNTKHTIVSVGTIGNREKGFISVKLSPEFKAAGRETQDTLNIMWGHGGKMGVLARTGFTVVVCANTFAMALKERGDFSFKVRHTSNAIPKLEGMSKAIDAHLHTVDEFRAQMDKLVKMPCSHPIAHQFFAGFLVRDEQPEEISTRADNQIGELLRLFGKGKGNNGKDMSDVFNAVTDYYTHDSSGGNNVWKQLDSSEFGMGFKRKQEAYGVLTGERVAELGDFETLLKRGSKVLQLV